MKRVSEYNIDLHGMFRAGNRWSLVAWFLAVITLIASVILVGFLSTFGLESTLWALWIMIVLLNITILLLANALQRQQNALLAEGRTRNASDFTFMDRSSPDPGQLVGMSVSVEVQEPAKEYPVDMMGKVTRYWRTSASDSIIVHLTTPLKWGPGKTSEYGRPLQAYESSRELTVENLVVWPAYSGVSLTRLSGFGNNLVACEVASLKGELPEETRIDTTNKEDQSKLHYLSHGLIKKAEHSQATNGH